MALFNFGRPLKTSHQESDFRTTNLRPEPTPPSRAPKAEPQTSRAQKLVPSKDPAAVVQGRATGSPLPLLHVVEPDSAIVQADPPQPQTTNSRTAESQNTPETRGLSRLVEALGYPWIGCLDGVVAADMRDDLVVLNMGCGDVVLVGTEKAFDSAHLRTVRESLTSDWEFSVNREVRVSPMVVKALNQQLARSTPLAFEARHVAVYDNWVDLAIKAHASDIHWYTVASEGVGYVRLRIYGRIRHWKCCNANLVEKALGAAFNSRAKGGSNSKEQFSVAISVSFMTQQTIKGVRWEGRFNGRPHIAGYKGVMRLLESDPKAESVPTLAELGYTASQEQIIKPAVETNFGLIILFGSTGSGKTTTVRTMIVRVMDPSKQEIYTVENPAEYPMPGTVQISLPVDVKKKSEEISAEFTAALRDLMRMDPDALMVGEVRDAETGRLLGQLTQTEHRTFSTCHGNSAIDGLSRLCGGEIQMQPDELAGPKFLSASIYQKLLPLLCPHCKLPANDPKHGLSAAKQKVLSDRFKLDLALMKVAKPGGCQHCKPKIPGMEADGTIGVTAAVEILIPNAEIRACIAARDWPGVDRLWRDQRDAGFGEPSMRGKTAFEAGLFKVTQGIVSLVDLEADFQPIETYEIRPLRARKPGDVA